MSGAPRNRPGAPRRPARAASPAASNASGAAAVEFAILVPVLVMMLFAILVYGGYFLLSHSVQQLANDAARAAVGGMTDAERRQLAGGALASELPTYPYLHPAATQLTYADASSVMTVTVAYDASASPFWALDGIIPMPPSAIVRSASVQVGGF